MVFEMPPTTKTKGARTIVVLTTKPANLASIPKAAIDAGTKIECFISGTWWAEATTESVTRSEKMCQTSVTPSKGTVTHTLQEILYTYMPQDVATVGADGNEAFDILKEDAVVYFLDRIGVDHKTAFTAGDAYRLIPVQCGYPTPTETQTDQGAEAAIKQQLFFAPGYSEPIDGVVAA